VASANLHAGSGAVKGVAIREFPLNPGHGFADYLLYVNGKACGVIEAKKEGATLSGVEVQSAQRDTPFSSLTSRCVEPRGLSQS
jgi:type I restriction enzyme, R subunit